MSLCGKAQFKLPGATDIPLCSGEVLLIGRPSVFECEFREAIEQDRPGFTERIIRNIQSYASHGAGRLHEILWDIDGGGNGPLSTRGICERIIELVRRGTLLAFVIPAVSQCDVVTESSQLESMSGDLPDANLVNANIGIEGVSFEELKSFQDKLVYVVRKSGDYFTAESFKEAFKNAMTATVVISTVVVLAFWAASHFVGGVGFAIDAILIAIGWAMIGWGIFSAMRSLLNCLKKTKNATSIAELDEAAKQLADTLTQVGIDLLIGLLTRGAGKLRAKTSAKPEGGSGSGGGKSKAEIEATNKAKADEATAKKTKETGDENTVAVGGKTYSKYQGDGPLYRGDSRSPDEIFDSGFESWAKSGSLENPPDDLAEYVAKNTKGPYVSTTKNADVATGTFSDGKYVYEIDPKGLTGIDVNQSLGPHPLQGEMEVAFLDEIPTSSIRGARPVLPDGTLDDLIPNPNFVPGN